MLKRYVPDYAGVTTSAPLSSLAKKITSVLESVRNISLLSEDTLYKYHIASDYMPLLYKKHISDTYANCIFCNHLVMSSCHKQCHKCSIGKYQQCRPLMPGLLNCASIYPYHGDSLKIPWYYTRPCSSFSRLPEENYFRNLNVPFSSGTVYNYETLESLEIGLLSGEKPCHVCASTDYEIYKKCYGQGDFHAHSPCRKIARELLDFYENRNQGSTANTEDSLSC